MKQSTRELRINDINSIINYFLQADHRYLKGMGVESSKLLPAAEWRKIILEDEKRSREQKIFYFVIWEVDNTPVGHSNINKIVYGQEAYIHFHLWKPENRMRGQGTYFIKESISRYFNKFHLQKLFCEPYTLNPAPNKTLPKIGFEFMRSYIAIPGWINFEQPVNRWVLTKEKWIME